MKTPKEVGALITLIFMLALGLLYPLTLILGNQELTNPDISFKLFLFSIILIGFSFGALIIYFTRYLWRNDNKYGDSFGFYSIGEKPALPFFKRFSAFQLFMLSLIIFASIFLLANILQNSGIITSNKFTSTITLPQQFSKTDTLLFSTFLIPYAEESMNIFVIGLLVILLIILSVKNKISPSEFNYYYFIGIPILTGILAVIWHTNAYPGNDTAKTVVFLFWAVKNLTIIGTGYVFVGINMHQMNNFFIDFPRLFSSDTVLTVAISSIVGLIALYWWIYKDNLFGGGKKPETILV